MNIPETIEYEIEFTKIPETTTGPRFETHSPENSPTSKFFNDWVQLIRDGPEVQVLSLFEVFENKPVELKHLLHSFKQTEEYRDFTEEQLLELFKQLTISGFTPVFE